MQDIAETLADAGADECKDLPGTFGKCAKIIDKALLAGHIYEQVTEWEKTRDACEEFARTGEYQDCMSCCQKLMGVHPSGQGFGAFFCQSVCARHVNKPKP